MREKKLKYYVDAWRQLKHCVISEVKRGSGFTFIEAILYAGIVAVMLTALIPFVWNIILGGSKSAIQQEVSGNARYISERIKYEIRNSYGVNSPSSGTSDTQLVLCEDVSRCNFKPTTIIFSGNRVQIKDKGASSYIDLNSVDVVVSGGSFINNSSSDGKTKNVSFTFTVSQANTSLKQDFKSSMTVQGSAEVRSN